MSMHELIPDPATLTAKLADAGYLADPGLATALFCAIRLPQPLLLEGEAGVGKTQAAKSLAELLDTPLIRLQCFEGIDASEALYEWNYPRQLLGIRVAEAQGTDIVEDSLFGPEYLIRRPLLAALVRARVPEASQQLADQVAAAVQRLRSLDVQKPPGVAEAIDWVGAASLMGLTQLDAAGVDATLGSVLKYREDHEVARAQGLNWVATGVPLTTLSE